MSTSKLIVGTLLAFAIFFVLDFIWYELIMSNFYSEIEGLYRETPLFPYIIVGMLVLGYAFCALYVKGYDGSKPLVSQGISHGVLVSLIAFVPMTFIYYGVYAYAPAKEYIVDLIYHVVQAIVAGIVIANYFGPIKEKPGRVSGGGI